MVKGSGRGLQWNGCVGESRGLQGKNSLMKGREGGVIVDEVAGKGREVTAERGGEHQIHAEKTFILKLLLRGDGGDLFPAPPKVDRLENMLEERGEGEIAFIHISIHVKRPPPWGVEARGCRGVQQQGEPCKARSSERRKDYPKGPSSQRSLEEKKSDLER